MSRGALARSPAPLPLTLALPAVLALVLSACDDGGSSWSTAARPRSRPEPAAAPDLRAWASSERDAATVGDAAAYVLPGMDCLVSDNAVRVKVLPTEPGIRCLDKVPGGILLGSPLKHFIPYYVFDIYPESGTPEYYRVGTTPRRDSIVGWAPAARLSRWDSRVGVRYARRDTGRTPPLLVYGAADPIVELLETGRTDAAPIARARLTSERTLMPWPVSRTRQVTVDGRVHEIVKIDFLAEIPTGSEIEGQEDIGAAPAAAYSEKRIGEISRSVKMLDIVFCVDNTASTEPFLDSIRQAVEEISVELADADVRPDLHFGMVLYRDYIDGLYFRNERGRSVVAHQGLRGDLTSFLAQVRQLHEASTSSDDWAEAGYDGLFAALTETPWRGGDLSARVVVLIGDNSFHEPESDKNPRNIGIDVIGREARARGIPVYTLSIDGAGGGDEQERHWDQMKAIADVTGGECYRIEDAVRVAREIERISGEQVEQVALRAEVTDTFIAGRSADEVAATHDLDIRKVTEVMEFLEGAGVDVDKLGRGVPTFASGWALVEMGDAPILEREVYIARNELDVLLGGLHQLRSHLSGAADFGTRVAMFSLGSHLDPLADFFSGRAAEPFDVYLMAKGIPVGRNSVLRYSESELRHMAEETRRALVDRIQKYCIPALVNALNDDSLWFYRDTLQFGWVDEAFLP